jgi:UDP-N-acetylglucosamine 2-epimerase (non-hydrolysing)
MVVCNVVGARPNFMKIAPIVHELRRKNIPQLLVHTGQHYDANMSQVFFDELGMPQPDIYLGVGSDTHARQTARIMTAFEEVCEQRRPGLVVVSGDVNSTLAAALVAAKLHIPVAHVEAGLRSNDREMPEEVNRVLTDHLSELLFTTEQAGDDNLRKEGINGDKIYFVGNCMVDTLLQHVEKAVSLAPWEAYDLTPGHYAVLTLHHPSNVDDCPTFTELMSTISSVSRHLPIVFPVHPRTRSRMTEWNIQTPPSLLLVEPLPYLPFLGLMAKAKFALTDSGGIQQETTVLKVPCLTLRWNTELPVTVTSGTNRLVGTDPQRIEESVQMIVNGSWKVGDRPPLWDGLASNRIANVIADWITRQNIIGP